MPELLSDRILFPLLQALLALLCVWILILDVLRHFKSRGSFEASVTRGSQSMAKFYGAYGVLTATFVGLSLTVSYAENYRVFFVIFDIALIAYACLWNAWFRNCLIGWSESLTKREH